MYVTGYTYNRVLHRIPRQYVNYEDSAAQFSFVISILTIKTKTHLLQLQLGNLKFKTMKIIYIQ